MKAFRVTVLYQPKGDTRQWQVVFDPLKASSARVALNYGIQAGQRHKSYTDSEIQGAYVSLSKKEQS